MQRIEVVTCSMWGHRRALCLSEQKYNFSCLFKWGLMEMCLIHSKWDLLIWVIGQKTALFKHNMSPEQELLILVNVLEPHQNKFLTKLLNISPFCLSSCTAAGFRTTPAGSVSLISQRAGFPPAAVPAPPTAAQPIWGTPLWPLAKSTDRWGVLTYACVPCSKQRGASVCERLLLLCLQGCYELVTAFIESNMGIIAGVTFGIAFSQV